MGSHTPGVIARALHFQVMEQVFIQIIGCRDGSVGKACLVQHLTCLFGKISQVSAVQTDAVFFKGPAGFLKLPEHADGVGYTGFQRVIGVYQKRAVVRVQIGISFKCSILIRKAHDPAVSMGSHDRNVKELPGQDIGRTDTAADDSGSCAIEPASGPGPFLSQIP